MPSPPRPCSSSADSSSPAPSRPKRHSGKGHRHCGSVAFRPLDSVLRRCPLAVGTGPQWKRPHVQAVRRILVLVAHGRTPERRDRLFDPPSDVRVTIIVASRGDRLRPKLRALGNSCQTRPVIRCLAGLAAVAALAGAAVGDLAGTGTPPRHGRSASARMLAEAAAYRFPLGCLGATLRSSSTRPSNATTGTGPCWHYGVYVTAVLRRVDGIWRLTLAARSDSCPSVPLPATVRALLVACTKNDTKVVRSPGSASRPR